MVEKEMPSTQYCLTCRFLKASHDTHKSFVWTIKGEKEAQIASSSVH